METAELIAGLLAGQRSCVAQALNLVDDERPASRAQALELLDALHQARAGCLATRLGVTGAPGAGKSTLLDALVRALRKEGVRVGVIAVDPSSRRSGGALLGDRLRMRAAADDDGVFVRSMAARDRLGGLADGTHASVAILACAFDLVIVESVGVGQSESDIAEVVDTLTFVAQPDSGDLLQFMKAGILEWPDLFVVNKADLGAPARRAAQELRSGLGLGTTRDDDWETRVLLCSARDAAGIDELVAGVRAHREHLEKAPGGLDALRRAGDLAFLRDAVLRRYGTYGLEQLGGNEGLEEMLRRDDEKSPFSLLSELARGLEAAPDRG